MSGDQARTALEPVEGLRQLGVALVRCDEEGIVRGQLAGCLPDALHRHELRRVGRQAMQLDEVPMLAKPPLAVVVETMTRRVVDDQEDLATIVAQHELAQELQERLPVEDIGEAERELGVVEGDGPVHVGGLAQPVGVDAGLNADPRPRAMQATVLPEAGFVFEDYDAATASGLFFSAGSVVLSQRACASWSARANRLRGRCTEKPS